MRKIEEEIIMFILIIFFIVLVLSGLKLRAGNLKKSPQDIFSLNVSKSLRGISAVEIMLGHM